MKSGRLFLCSTLLLAGCGLVSPAPGAPQQPKADAPAKAATTPAPEAKTPPPAEKKEAVPKERQLVANGRLEDWEEGLPKGWVGDVAKIAKAKETTSGEGAVELKVDEQYTLIEQVVSGVPKGVKFLVSAKIKAAEPKDAAIKVLYYQGDEMMEVRKQYSGGGDWSVNSFEMTLPQEASSAGFRIQIIRNPEAAGPVLIDDVALIVPASAPAAPKAPEANAPAAEKPAEEKAAAEKPATEEKVPADKPAKATKK